MKKSKSQKVCQSNEPVKQNPNNPNLKKPTRNLQSNINKNSFPSYHLSKVSSKEKDDVFEDFQKIKSYLLSNINIELNNQDLNTQNILNNLISLFNNLQNEIFNNRINVKNKNLENNKLKEIVENNIQKIFKYLSNILNNIDLNKKNILHKVNSGLEKINTIFIKNILNNQNRIIPSNKIETTFLQNDNVISLINSISRLIKLYMTKESILIKQLRDNFTKLNTIKNITNDIEENGLIFFNEAKDIFKKLKEIQTSYSKQMVLSPTLSSGIKPHQKKNFKNSNSLNHFNSKTNYSFFNIKNNDINNMKLLAALGNLNNSFTTNSSNNFSNISIEKEYLNTNPSTSIINNEMRNRLNNNLNISAEKEKEKISNLKNSFMSVKTETKNSDENISLNKNNLGLNLAKKILEFFQEMNNLQKAIVQKKNNIHSMKKKFEITKKNIENFALEIQRNNYKKNNNKNNIIIIDDEDKKETNNNDNSIELKKEKINYIKKKNVNTNNNNSKLKEYEKIIKGQKEKIDNLQQSNETLIKDKKRLNAEILNLQNQINEITKIINEKAQNLNLNSKSNVIENLKEIFDSSNSNITLININNNNNNNSSLMNNPNENKNNNNNNNNSILNNNLETNNNTNNNSSKLIKQEIENGSTVNKYYEENIQLKKLFQECINIINTIVKNNSKKYSNIEFPSLTEDSDSENSSEEDIIISNENSKLNTSLEESFIINGENVKYAIDLFKKYNNEMSEIMSKMKDKIYSLKEANKALNEIIQSSNVEQVEEKELINFDDKDNFFLKDL